MLNWTYASMKAKVLADLDLQDEDFISSSEMLAYFNEAIDDVEAVIHDLCPSYFRTFADVPLIAGQQNYSFPTDVYAMKVEKFLYNNCSERYKITRLKTLEDTLYVQTADRYRYLPINTGTGGYQFRIYPAPRATESNVATLWYIRNAARLVNDTDVCDIPEFINFILQHVKCSVRSKENGGTVPPADAAKLQMQRDLLEGTLGDLTADPDDNKMMPDLSFYEEMS